MIRVGLIGAGKIGGPVARAIESTLSDRFALVGTLTSRGDADAFFDAKPDLIIEAAGAGAVTAWGARALSQGDLWVSSSAALVDVALHEKLGDIARTSATSLVILPGAIAGLDAVRTGAVDPEMTLTLSICLAPSDAPRQVIFSGTVTEAARRFPADVNVAVAAALAGHGPDRTHIDVIRPTTGEPRDLRLSVRSAFGDFDTVSKPKVIPAQSIHTVAANIIATLAEYQPRKPQA